MSDLSGTVIQWRDLTIYGRRGVGRHAFSLLEGWEERRGEREVAKRALGHGSMGSAPRARGRTVLVRADYLEPTDRDTVFAELDAAFALTDDVDAPAEDLTITHAGRTLTAPVWLTRWTPAPTPAAWGAGAFSWVAEFVSDDWLRYGDPVSASATFPARTGGLVFPLFPGGVMDFGTPSTSNRLALTNTGVAAASLQHTVTGPIDADGFEIVEVGSGARLVYEGAVPAASSLLLDGATGNVLLDGRYDRGDLLTHRDWPRVPKGASVELAFIRRGSNIGGLPALKSTLRPAFW